MWAFALIPIFGVNDETSFWLAVGLFITMMFSYSGYNKIHSHMEKQCHGDIIKMRMLVRAVSHLLSTILMLLLTVAYYLLNYSNPLEYLSIPFGIFSGLIFILCFCLFCNFRYTKNVAPQEQEPDFFDNMHLGLSNRIFTFFVWVFALLVNVSFYSFMPIATDWYASVMIATKPEIDLYEQGFGDLVLIFSSQLAVQSAVVAIYFILHSCERAKYYSISQSIVNTLCAVILTISLFMITFAVDVPLTIVGIMTGFGNAIIQLGSDTILVLFFKKLAIDVPSLYEKSLSWFEFFSMVGQIIAFSFLWVNLLLGDYQFMISSFCGGVASLIGFGFIYKSFKAVKAKKTVKTNTRVVRSRTPHFDSETGGRSVVFRGVSKRH